MFTTFNTTLVIRIKLGDNYVVCSNTGGQVTLKGIQFFAYYVPEFRVNLLSVSQLDTQGFKTTCEYGHCLIEKANQLLLVAEMKNGLYQVSTTTKRNNLGNYHSPSLDDDKAPAMGHGSSLDDKAPVTTPATTPAATPAAKLPMVAIGKHNLSFESHSIQDLDALADAELLWDV